MHQTDYTLAAEYICNREVNMLNLYLMGTIIISVSFQQNIFSKQFFPMKLTISINIEFVIQIDHHQRENQIICQRNTLIGNFNN